MCQSSMSILKVFLFIISLPELCTSYIFNEYPNNSLFLDYYVTSTDFPVFHSATQPESGIKSVTCEIQLEEHVIYQVILQLKKIDLWDSKTNVLIYEAEKSRDSTIFNENNFHVLEGYVLRKKKSSSITGYIKNYSFYGTIFLDKIIYFVEDLKDYSKIFMMYKDLGKNAVVFKQNALNLTIPQTNIGRENSIYRKHVDYLISNNERKVFKSIIGTGKVCSLFVMIDNSFLRVIHKGNLRAAVAQVLSYLEESNSIFRSTDFDLDGYPDNIGFRIKYFIVLQSAQSPMNLLPKKTNYPINVNEFMRAFSSYKFLNEVCLGIVFTGHSFKNQVLGGSYSAEPVNKNHFNYPIGGICDRPLKFQAHKNLNTIAISPKTQDGLIAPKHVMDVCVAHEFGHSFGSDHDTSEKCVGHIMTANAPNTYYRKHFTFSVCSKEIIVKTVISKGHCFENYTGTYCGNGIVEEGESCDCGTIRDCQALDACCIPRGRTNACKPYKKDNIDCHPSQGVCCNSVCKYKNLRKFDLDCRGFEKQCPCQRAESCLCGVQGECTRNVCSSQECTRISLSECDCPVNVVQNKCRTCCWYHDFCVPSDIASVELINNNRLLIEALKGSKDVNKSRSLNFGYYNNYCDGSLCVELYFRATKPNDLCLLYGEVGICTAFFQCEVPRRKRIFPVFQVLDNEETSAPFTRMLPFNFLLVVMCNLLFEFY